LFLFAAKLIDFRTLVHAPANARSMLKIFLPAIFLLLSINTYAQRTVKLNKLWEKPQVYVAFEGYTLSFKIKDINRALVLLAEAGDSSYGLHSGLDSAGRYTLELFPGSQTEYRTKLQALMQKGVGVFLLLAGHAEIKAGRRKLKEIIADIQPIERDEPFVLVNFYDPKNNRLLFSGSMLTDMYNKDLGIE
jgi:hypothetical protein